MTALAYVLADKTDAQALVERFLQDECSRTPFARSRPLSGCLIRRELLQ